MAQYSVFVTYLLMCLRFALSSIFIGNDSRLPGAIPPPKWGTWEQWSACSTATAELSTATRNRSRLCHSNYGDRCVGESLEISSCTELDASSWSEWEQNGPCSVSCGSGFTQSTRSCLGLNCKGSSFLWEECWMGNCCADWSSWQAGDTPYSRQMEGRTRICIEETTEKETRFGAYVTWSEWTAFSSCSTTCGYATKVRTRYCIAPRGYEGRCDGDSSQTATCTNPACRRYDFSTTWTHWSPCSVTCGRGVRHRARICNHGLNCQGQSLDRESCQTVEYC